MMAPSLLPKIVDWSVGFDWHPQNQSDWWFQTLIIFHNIWDNPSHWLIFFRGVETTNQKLSMATSHWSLNPRPNPPDTSKVLLDEVPSGSPKLVAKFPASSMGKVSRLSPIPGWTNVYLLDFKPPINPIIYDLHSPKNNLHLHQNWVPFATGYNPKITKQNP